MSSEATAAGERPAAAPRLIGQAIDRWIYVFTAVLFIATALAGFIPDSRKVLAQISSGLRPALPHIYHVHAVLMGCWLLLFLAQALLMATGYRQQHKTLGIAALVIGPLMVATMVGMPFYVWRTVYSSATAAVLPADVLMQLKSTISNVLFEEIHAIIMFPVFVGWALLVRNSDPESHKRLLVLAILSAITAAFDRIPWLPTTAPGSFASSYGYGLMLVLPAFINDFLQRGRLHSAYVIGLGLTLVFFAINLCLWDSPAWFAATRRLMGVAH